MKQEVIDFYAANRIPVSKMVQVGVRRRGLSAESIKSSAEAVYEDIVEGRIKIKPIQIAWEVYGRSSPTRMDMNPASLAAILNAVEKTDEKMVAELRAIREILSAPKKDKDKVVAAVEASISSVNSLLAEKIDAISEKDRLADDKVMFQSLQAAIENLGLAMKEYSTPWYKKLWRWFK